MICVVIKGPTIEDACKQIAKAAHHADLVELRLDCFTFLDFAGLNILRSYFSLPMIFTLRSRLQGGNYMESEEHRIADVRRLIALTPEYLDVEHPISFDLIADLSSRSPKTKLILSYHNFIETPQNLEEILQVMKKTPAAIYKVAAATAHCLDALRLICWAKQSNGLKSNSLTSLKHQLIAISMGSHGQISRILGPMIGSPIAYASPQEDQKSAPGQLPAKILIERFHYHSLNPNTRLYGLIGHPVDQSMSDQTHNSLIATCDLDAVYVKIQVSPEELFDFLQFARQFPFDGLSVTMPLKEQILPFLDHIDPQAREIGAVNTLLFEKGRISGFNTDGIGALNAIEKEIQVKGKQIVIIGAGGAARAIAYEAHRRGSLITIVNRDEAKAFRIAQNLHCIGKGLDYMKTCAEMGYDVLINCTPVPMPISPNDILQTAVLMDIKTKPQENGFLKIAMDKGCRMVPGYEMFIEQALGQFRLWFPGRIDMEKSRNFLKSLIMPVQS